MPLLVLLELLLLQYELEEWCRLGSGKVCSEAKFCSRKSAVKERSKRLEVEPTCLSNILLLGVGSSCTIEVTIVEAEEASSRISEVETDMEVGGTRSGRCSWSTGGVDSGRGCRRVRPALEESSPPLVKLLNSSCL